MIDRLLSDLDRKPPRPVYLVAGDLVLAEPAAVRLGEALAERAGCPVEVRRHPPHLAPLLADLRTLALFAPGKVVVAVDTAVLADRAGAAALIDAAERALPVGEDLGERGRAGASRLLQALRLFDVDPQAAEPEAALGSLPAWAFAGGPARRRKSSRGRGKKQVETLRNGLVELLAAARREGLVGWAEGDLDELAAVVRDGLPPGHTLVLAEQAVAADHPLVASLAEAGAAVRVGEVESERGGGWAGLDAVAAELERQTGVAITRDALSELARRTLRHQRKAVDGDSTARLAGEYRKLATLAGDGRIDRAMVEEAVIDRGEEDVWQLLDAIGAGRAAEALDRLSRHLAAASDPLAARLAFFGLLASFCRQLTAVAGLMPLAGVAAGESHYPRFKARLAPRLTGAVPGGGKNPLAGLHPYRLHRVYLAAGRLPAPRLATLPALVLETELRLKGESSDPDAALAGLVVHLAGGGRGSRARARRSA